MVSCWSTLRLKEPVKTVTSSIGKFPKVVKDLEFERVKFQVSLAKKADYKRNFCLLNESFLKWRNRAKETIQMLESARKRYEEIRDSGKARIARIEGQGKDSRESESEISALVPPTRSPSSSNLRTDVSDGQLSIIRGELSFKELAAEESVE